MYDIAKDPGEADNLAVRMPKLIVSLGQLLDDYIAASGGDVTIGTD